MQNQYKRIGNKKRPAEEWQDLKNATEIRLEKGEVALIPLKGNTKTLQEVRIRSKSTVLDEFGIVFANYKELVDTPYIDCNNTWYMPILALRDTNISNGTSICEFALLEK